MEEKAEVEVQVDEGRAKEDAWALYSRGQLLAA